MPTITLDILPKQDDFLAATEREVLYSGAFGAGKSRALCLRIAERVSGRPAAREGLCRKYLVTLKATTLKTLLEPDGDLPPVLPEGSYQHNRSDKTIRINGGGQIVYFGLDDPSKIGSYQLSGCGVDQAEELAEVDWTALRGRMRVNVSGLRHQLYGACNPASPSHFLARRFGLAGGETCQPNCAAVVTKSSDNWFLPPEYLADLATFVGLAKERYVEGRWVGSEGLVYDRWNRNDFLAERTEREWSRIIVGVDQGYTNPAVLLPACVDGDGRIHVAFEWYKRRQLEASTIDAALDMRAGLGACLFVVDPSAAALIAAMRSAGLDVQEANNDVFAGIQAVQQRLIVCEDGRPRLTVDPRCENTIREFETYEWKTDRDQPKKESDHAMDALRYAVAHVDDIGQQEGFGLLLGNLY